MKAVRYGLIAVILVNLALLATVGPFRSTMGRYDLARKQGELRALAVEHRALLGAAAQARRPDCVAARAASMGIDLRLLENESLVTSTGASPADRRPLLVPAPRR